MKRTLEETNNATPPTQKPNYIALAQASLSTGSLTLAMHYSLRAQQEVILLNSQIAHVFQLSMMQQQTALTTQLQTTIPPILSPTNTQQHGAVLQSSVPNPTPQQQTTTLSSAAPRAIGAEFYTSLDKIMASFLTFLVQKEYSKPYSRLRDTALVDTASQNLINFMQGKGAFQLRAILDKLRDLVQNLISCGIPSSPIMTQNHYILKHLQWAAYFHLSKKLISLDTLTAGMVALTKLELQNLLPSKDCDFSYRAAYISFVQDYLSDDKFSLKHPLLLRKLCAAKERLHIAILHNIVRFCNHANKSELNTVRHAVNAYHQLALSSYINHDPESGVTSIRKEKICISMEKWIEGCEHNDLIALSLRAVYAVLFDETSREIKSTIAGIHHFADAHNAQGSIVALFLDAMARIAKQAGDLINAKRYAISALEKCQEYNIEFPPEYKLHAIAQIALPDVATNNAPNNAPNHPEVDDLDRMLERDPNMQLLESFTFDPNRKDEVWIDTTASSTYSLTQVPMTPHVTNTPDINALQHTQGFEPEAIDTNPFFS